MEDPKPEVKPEAVSPNGQLVGLSALLNKLPPWAMNILISVIGLAAAAEVVAQASPDLLPPIALKVAHGVAAVAVVAGMASPGVRK
jgi:hypothetical protein